MENKEYEGSKKLKKSPNKPENQIKPEE